MEKSVKFVKKKIENKFLKDKKYFKVTDYCRYAGKYRGAAHSICNLKYSLPKQISIDFHDWSNYDYHFIIKDLAEELKKQFSCLGENTENYITFIVPIEKEVTRIEKNGEEITKKYFTYYNLLIQLNKWQILFMASSLPTLVNNLSELSQKLSKQLWIHGWLGKIQWNIISWKRIYLQPLNMEDITDADYAHANRVFKDSEIKYLGEYHDFYVQSNSFLSAPGLAWQAALKKTKVKIDLLNDIDMLLMIEKGIRGGIYHLIYRYAKAKNKYMKDYDKNKEPSYIQYWDVSNLYGWAIFQEFTVNNFEWIKDTFQCNEDSIKNCNEGSDERWCSISWKKTWTS